MSEAFIYDAVRTPRGKNRGGALHSVKPIDLVTGLIDALRERNPDLDDKAIDDIVLGVVSPVGEQGSDIARVAAIVAGLDESVAGVQVNRFCASGLEAVNLAAQKVGSGFENLVLAGGVESMSRVPLGSDGGAWAQDPTTNYDTYFVPQGIGADLIATTEGFTRTDVDAFAAESQKRAAAAWENSLFENSIIPVKDINGITVLDRDEHMRPGSTVESLSQLPRLSPSSPLRPDSTRWLCRSTTGSKPSTTSTPPRTPPESSTELRWSSSATRKSVRRWG